MCITRHHQPVLATETQKGRQDGAGPAKQERTGWKLRCEDLLHVLVLLVSVLFHLNCASVCDRDLSRAKD